jgi:hypothetical protein
MRFQVPQFIDMEDKIFGPLTLKQFIYVAGGAGIAIIFFTLLPKFFAFLLSAPFVGVALALAFYKPNNRPFVFALESMLNFYLGEKLYVWKKIPKPIKPEEDLVKLPPQLTVPSLSGSKLKDLNWALDVKKAEENDKTGI